MKNILLLLLVTFILWSCDSPQEERLNELKKKYPHSMIYQCPDQQQTYLLQDSNGLHYVNYYNSPSTKYTIITLYNLNK